LVGNSEAKMPIEKRRLQWLGNIKMDIKELELPIMQWIYLAQDCVPKG
jgi:hypothetical protein